MTSIKPMHMEVDVSLSQPLPPPDEGTLGDDELPEKEAMAAVKVTDIERSPPSTSPTDEQPQRKRSCSRTESFSLLSTDVNGRKKKHRRGKNKGGHRHHRQWKPYTKMTWEEKKELDEWETRRAFRKREQRFASGQPMAPYNTTQFLMEQHQHSDVNLEDTSRSKLNKCGSVMAIPDGGSGGASGGSGGDGDLSSEDYYSSPDDEEIFLEKEFTQDYENFHAERLQTMTKDELIKEYLELESKVELMEKKLKEENKSSNGSKLSTSAVSVTEERTSTGDIKEGQTVSINDSSHLTVSANRVPDHNKDEEAVKETITVSALQKEILRLRQDNEKLQLENERLRRTQVSNTVNAGEP